MNETNIRRWFGGFAAALVIGGCSSNAAEIAYWKFEAQNLGADSSPNGLDLAVTDVTSSAEKDARAPGTGSGVFSGTSFGQTIADLDLSSYQGVTFEWFMKSSQEGLGIIFELSENYNGNAGTVVCYINEASPDQIVWANFTSGGYSIVNGKYPQDGQWHHYAVTIDTGRTDAQRQKIFIDGVDTAATGTPIGGTQAEPLGVFPFFVGARGGANFFMNALIDEFRISDKVLEPDQFLLGVTYPNAALSIDKQPQDLTALENQTANGGQPVVLDATVNVTGAPQSAIRYQWQIQAPGTSTWSDIPDATATTYAITNLARTQTRAKYRLVARVIGSSATVTSREAVLTITPDSTPPRILSAGAIAGTVGICFNEAVDPGTGALGTHYQVSGATVTGAELQPDGRSVKLSVDNLSAATFTVTVSGINDLAGNTIVANSQATGKVSPLIAEDIGAAPLSQAGSVFSCADNAYNIAAGGNDIWNTADSFQFLHAPRTGDFDIRVQVKSITEGAGSARGGLMVREDLSPGSRNFTTFVYSQQDLFWSTIRAETDGATAVIGPSQDYKSAGVVAPNVWLRLKREGDTFRSFWSKDGGDWQALATYTPTTPYPNTVELGLGTTAQRDAEGFVIRAEYDNFSEVVLGEATISITSQPSNITRPEGAGATFKVAAQVAGVPASELTYQWQRDGVDIPGANSATYSFSPLTTGDSGARFRAVLKAAGKQLSSDEATLTVTPNPGLVKRTITGVTVFRADTKELNNRGDENNSIDGDITSLSYMTPSGTEGPNVAAFDLGDTPMLVNRLRLAKLGNDDGLAGQDRMDLEIWYSTDTGPLESRNYQRVSGLQNGYYDSELVVADKVSVAGTVDNEDQDLTLNGWFSLTFNAANATAIAIQFAREATDPQPFTHYPIYEFELYHDPNLAPAVAIEAHREGKEAVLAWPAGASGYSLQSSDKLGVGANWVPVAAQVTTIGGNKVVRITADVPARFYRLAR